MKRILILGAGIYQSRLILSAKNRGIETHVASIEGNYPGIEMADYFHPIDTTDEAEILQLATSIKIDAILTTGSDVCVPTIGLVADKLGLAGTGRRSSKICMDKRKMKTAFLEAEVPTPNFEIVSSIKECRKAVEKLGFPCVIKAPDSSGSRGINTVYSFDEVDDSYEDSAKVSRCGELIVEEWVFGEEYGAQAVVCDSQLIGLMIHADVVTPPPRRIPVGHSAPHPKENSMFKETKECVERAILATGIDNTISNVDLILTERGPVIIEIAARMGGTCIPEVCGKWWGVDLYDMALDISLGMKVEFPKSPTGVPNAAHLVWSNEEGTIRSFGPKEEGLAWNIEAELGTKVSIFTSGNLRLGDVSSSSDNTKISEEEVSRAANDFMRGLIVN